MVFKIVHDRLHHIWQNLCNLMSQGIAGLRSSKQVKRHERRLRRIPALYILSLLSLLLYHLWTVKYFLNVFSLGSSGWETNGDYCYFVKSRSNGYTYNEARDSCLEQNATLTSVANIDEQNFLNGKLTVTSPYTHCILIHEARSIVFMIIITEKFSILQKFVNDI